MKTEREQCKEILERFYAGGKFETTDRAEVYAIYILQRKGCVVADLIIDSVKGEYSATIKDVTIHGKQEFLEEVPKQGGVPRAEIQKIILNAQLDTDKARDSVLLHLASGGIALAFGIVSFLEHLEVEAFALWAISVGLWILSLLSLLSSYTTARIMYNHDPSLCSSQKAMRAHVIAAFLNKWMNRLATALFILGLTVFTAFAVIKAQGVIE